MTKPAPRLRPHSPAAGQHGLGILPAVSEALNSSPDVRHALEKTLSLVADMLGLRTREAATDEMVALEAGQPPEIGGFGREALTSRGASRHAG